MAPIPMIQFQRRESPSGGLIEQALGFGLSQLISLPFEKSREKRAEREKIDSEQRAMKNALDQLKRTTEYAISAAPAEAKAKAEAGFQANRAQGAVLSEAELPPDAADLYRRGLLSPSHRRPEGLFFDLGAVEAARSGEQPIPEAAEDLNDRALRYFGVRPSVVAQRTTRREFAETQPALGPNIQISDIQSRDKQTQEMLLARLIEPVSAAEQQEAAGRIIDTDGVARPFTDFDLSARKNAPKLRQLRSDARNDPQVQAVIQRADEIDKAIAEGRVRTVSVGQKYIEEAKKAYFEQGMPSELMIRNAGLALGNMNLLWRRKGDELRPITGDQRALISDELKRNDDLLTAWEVFRSTNDMQDVLDSEKVTGGMRLTPGALGYLQIMYRTRGVEKWSHPNARYDTISLPEEVTRQKGIFRTAPGDSLPPTPPTPPRREPLPPAGPAQMFNPVFGGSGAVPAETGGRLPTFDVGGAALEQKQASYRALTNEIFTDFVSNPSQMEQKYQEIRQWIEEGHATPEAAADFNLRLGVSENDLQVLRAGTDAEKRAAMARMKYDALQAVGNARSAYLDKINKQ